MERAVLLSKNPWWKGKEHFIDDPDYIKWKEEPINWVPEVIKGIETEPFSLHFILGPRQVGKTTLVKLKIKDLLESEKIKPEQVFYFRCDELKDYKELDQVLQAYFEFREESETSSSFIFLDEITFAEEWFRAIKEWIDNGKLKKDVLVVTGSASFEILKHTEYFPGRRGNGKDFFVLPLSFREFVKLMEPKICEKISCINSLEEAEIKDKSKKAFLYLNELDKLLKVYIKIGGFPLAINSYVKEKKVTETVKETYLNWIKNDLTKVNKDVNIAREILKVVATKIPSTLSWEGIAKETSIKSPKTIASYLNVFQELFLLLISPYLDPNKLTIEFGKNKKIHFLDPLFYELVEEWGLLEIKDKENKKAENLVASHLSRFGRRFKTIAQEVYYWKNGLEIDVLARAKDKAIGFEVKFGSKAEEIKAVFGRMKKVYVISRDSFAPEKRIIPLSIFLALLDV